jgi:hypothetical protein
VNEFNLELMKKTIKEELNKINWANLANIRSEVDVMKAEVRSLK